MGKERDPFFASLPKNLTYEQVETVSFGGRLVGKGQPALLIAEIGANHRGDIGVALRAIEAAAKAGADAVKFQHLTHDKIAADTPFYESQGKIELRTLSAFYKPSEMPYEWTPQLKAHAEKCGVMFLSTPFDKDAVDVLAQAGVVGFKVASYELGDDILLRYIARKGKPMIISTGMAYLEEVAHAVRVIQEEGNTQIVVLHCVSIYPPKAPEDFNLRAIETLRHALKLPIGFSDHTQPPSISPALGAIALGACVIERHFTDDQSGGSADDENSLNPAQFANMVKEVRVLENALLAAGIKQPVSKPGHKLTEDEIADRWARRSVYAARDIAVGEVVAEADIITLRPWGGMEPKDFKLVEGKKLTRAIKAREALTLEHFLQ